MLQLLYCHSSSCSYIYCSFRARFIVTARTVCCRVYITVRCPYVCLTACLSIPFVDFCSSVLRFFLLLTQRAGDINQLQQWATVLAANASSVTFQLM